MARREERAERDSASDERRRQPGGIGGQDAAVIRGQALSSATVTVLNAAAGHDGHDDARLADPSARRSSTPRRVSAMWLGSIGERQPRRYPLASSQVSLEAERYNPLASTKMSLASGARLDTYEIVTPLGAGAMGEV